MDAVPLGEDACPLGVGVAPVGADAVPLGEDVSPLDDCPLAVDAAPPVADVVPLVAELSCALAGDRGDNETKAAAPSAMAETRRAPFVMATSLEMGGAARRRKPPFAHINFTTREPFGRSFESGFNSRVGSEAWPESTRSSARRLRRRLPRALEHCNRRNVKESQCYS